MENFSQRGRSVSQDKGLFYVQYFEILGVSYIYALLWISETPGKLKVSKFSPLLCPVSMLRMLKDKRIYESQWILNFRMDETFKNKPFIL